MSRTAQMWFAHSGLLFAIVLGAGIFFIPGWLPPVDPGLSADAIAGIFERDRLRIRFGMMLAAFGSIFYLTFSAVIANQCKRIEGESHPLTYLQLVSIPGTYIVIWLAAYIWLVAAYRPETPPDIVRTMNDFAWIIFIGGFQPAFAQWLAIAWCILKDKREKPIYPRWMGFATIWITLTTFLGGFLAFFHSGPFTWNGAIGFWLAATLFFGWLIVMWRLTVRAVKQEFETNAIYA